MTPRLLAVLAGLFAVPLLAVSAAWACTALATIDMDHKKGAVAGDTVNGTGRGFDRAPTSSPVEVHLNGRTGPLLASVRPDINGNVVFSFTAPQGQPGDYVIVATQTNAQGQAVSGSPAKAPFTLLASPAAAPAAAPAAPAQQPPARQPAAAPAAPAQPAVNAAPVPAQPVSRPAAPAIVPAPAPVQAVAPAAPVTVPVPAGERAVMMSPATQALTLPLVMVAVGLLLTVGSGALVLGTRRRDETPARAQAHR